MTHRKDVVTWADIMAMPLDQIPKGDPFARGNAPVDPLRAQSMANALRMQTRRPADDLRRQIEAIDSMPWKELRDSVRLALVELAEVKPALHDALCTRHELEERLLTAEERLEQRTRERDHERATLAGVLACSGFTYSDGETLLRAQAAEAQQLARQMMDERDKLRAECAALRRELAALMDDH
jgi:hypothetical protein